MSTYVDVPLDLDLDGDVPLPFDARVEELSPETEVARLRRALADAVTALEGGPFPQGPRLRAWRQLAGIPAHDAGQTPAERRDDGIARAAARWTAEETDTVDTAIATVARDRLAAIGDTDELTADGPTFTTADVWAVLGPGFPVTKGIAGRMAAARGAGLIANTGRTVIAPRDATGPNHGQRLTVWRAL